MIKKFKKNFTRLRSNINKTLIIAKGQIWNSQIIQFSLEINKKYSLNIKPN